MKNYFKHESTSIIIFSRRYTQDSNPFYYPHEKYFCGDPTPELPGWDNNSNTSDGDQAIPVHLFPKHVSELHMDQVIRQLNWHQQPHLL